MVKVTDKDYYMDGYLEQNLRFAKEKVKDDWDFIFIVDGKERRGKSVLAQQMAYYVDPTFNIDRVCFTSEEFETKIKASTDKGQAFIFDEAYSDTNSGAAMGKVARALKKTMTEIGQKNLFIFIVLPPFFDLGKYWAIWRSVALVHVYTGADMQRGRFLYFNEDKKKLLYINGKKEYNYNVVTSNFHGVFTKFYTVDEEEYKKRKSEAIYNADKDLNEEKKLGIREIRALEQRNILIERFLEFKTPKEIADWIKVDVDTISRAKKEATLSRYERITGVM